MNIIQGYDIYKAAQLAHEHQPNKQYQAISIASNVSSRQTERPKWGPQTHRQSILEW